MRCEECLGSCLQISDWVGARAGIRKSGLGFIIDLWDYLSISKSHVLDKDCPEIDLGDSYKRLRNGTCYNEESGYKIKNKAGLKFQFVSPNR
jgi:hypothetical protein